MISDLNPDEKLLMDYMSTVSERCYSAGWMADVEYVLWGAVNAGPRKYGHGQITTDDIQRLIQLSGKADCWIVMDDEREELALDLETWKKRFETAVRQNPDILRG